MDNHFEIRGKAKWACGGLERRGNAAASLQRPSAAMKSGNLFGWLRRGKEGDLLLSEWFENKKKR